MSRLLIFLVFFAVAFDFATPDAVLLMTSARVLQADDEEESVPSRRQRVGEGEQRVPVFKVAPGSIEKEEVRPSAERRANADRILDQEIWRLPFKQALLSSAHPASTPEAH